MIVREAGVRDIDRLGALYGAVFVDTYATAGLDASIARHVLSEFSRERMASVVADASRRIWVAEHDQSLLGALQVRVGRDDVEIERLYVLRPFRGRGIGSRLLACGEALLAARVWLTVWVENERALRFYAARGYRDRGGVWIEFGGRRVRNRVLDRAARAPEPPPEAPG